MTEAGWTAEVPKEIGVYWWRSNAADNHPWIVRVHKGWLGLMLMQTMGGPLVTIGDGGEWLGPISPTDRQQGRVACLGDVKRYVERQIKIGEDFIGGPDPNIQRRVALNEVIEYCDRQLAQQAQEGGVGDGKV